MAEEVGEAVAEGEGFAREVCGSVGVAGGAVVTEVADFEDVGIDAAGFSVPTRRGIVKGYRLNGHAEIIGGNGGEGFPFGHQVHLGDALFEQGSVDGIAVSPKKACPIAKLPDPDAATEEMLENMRKDENDVLISPGKTNSDSSILPNSEISLFKRLGLDSIDLFIDFFREITM